ncbi:protein of unknown function DUF161 [Coriobacterium glomerans PW2]|uniref:DUF2179 domain-containing protein n=1 Tax=Coriobacterium glomerans (strain ATCC 49209 / DSM 20642 / JCM 10262 / PW2) TaxID=700015 RepID=F2N785_CORGP|nr:YitT family protein [Coriobacterium glomerans]AEB06560.1 protein of unknown function DUF161 [Coriobacterium glomerans PW2]
MDQPREPRKKSSRARLLRRVVSGMRDPSDRAVRRSREEREARRREVLDRIDERRRQASARETKHAWIGLPEAKIDLKAELARLKDLRRRTIVRRCVTLSSVVLSAFLQAYTIQVFVQPAGLLSSGFTGLAILIDRVTSLFGVSFPTFAGMLVLNVPVALLCWRSISKRFVIFSMVQVVSASMFLRFLNFAAIIRTPMLEVVFGGFLYGFSIALALRGGASTAGTDFISLMVSNRTGKSIWGSVFVGNCIVLAVFGALFGWEAAAYSIIFQFISTKTIEMFYHRYDRLTLQVITQKPDQILAAYNRVHKHGSSVMEVLGGRSRDRYWLINTVISAYELDDVIQLVRVEDGGAVVNVMRTENFFGNFYRPPID